MRTGLHPRRVATALGVARLLPSYVAFGVLRHIVPLPALARWAWQAPSFAANAASEGRPQTATRDRERERTIVARVVKLRHLFEPAHGDCLQSSLVLYRELSRAGADPTLVVGFQQSARGLSGHAWVVTDDTPAVECAESLVGFAPTVAFGRDGKTAAVPGTSPAPAVRLT